MWDALVNRLSEASEPWDADDEIVPLGLATCLAGPAGPEYVADGLRRIDTPVAPELFKTTAF
jgi:hypothetical protein